MGFMHPEFEDLGRVLPVKFEEQGQALPIELEGLDQDIPVKFEEQRQTLPIELEGLDQDIPVDFDAAYINAGGKPKPATVEIWHRNRSGRATTVTVVTPSGPVTLVGDRTITLAGLSVGDSFLIYVETTRESMGEAVGIGAPAYEWSGAEGVIATGPQFRLYESYAGLQKYCTWVDLATVTHETARIVVATT